VPLRPAVAVVSLGCGRNDVDSEELAGRLDLAGFRLTDDPEQADAVVVNTCGFVEAAKKDSIDTLLAAAELKEGGRTRAVIAVGCLAERYGAELAEQLPEADAVLSFDDYADIGGRVRAVLDGERLTPHVPRDRRTLLPITPAERGPAAQAAPPPGHAGLAVGPADRSGPPVVRRRLTGGPVAAVKLASGCDRRCAFCAIPTFRGSFVSRPVADVVAEAAWLAADGVRELVLVSENSTSYGKDLGELRLLEQELLPRLVDVPGIERVRVVYLQPAEMRSSLVTALTSLPGVARYADLSFQHSSATVLRRMRRFGDTDRFLELIAGLRAAAPEIGVRSNVIVGFPGETEEDVAELERFLVGARLDAIGVFGYSDEDGTEAERLPDKLPDAVIRRRVERLTTLAEELTAQRAADRIGTTVDVLVEEIGAGGRAEGRAEHQAPEVDGSCRITGLPPGVGVGAFVRCTVTDTDGVDLLVAPLSAADPLADIPVVAAVGR
jgi:ribosomal protein S12 methylthiotransferase